MSINKRFSTNSKGALLFTGNTLGLYGTLNPPQAGRVVGVNDHSIDGIGAFISTDTSLMADGDYPAGSTTDWKLNSSAAMLDLPDQCTILHAELFWAGTCKTQVQDVTAFINQPVKLTLPDGSIQSIAPDSSTSQDLSSLFDTSLMKYLRSADITSFVQEKGRGPYTVSSVPGALGAAGGSSGPWESTSLGWTLAIVIEDLTQPYRYMSLWSSLDVVSGNSPNTALDIFFDDFTTPITGPVNGRLLISALSGSNHLPGDIIKFGADYGQLVTLHGPNNPGIPTPNNFFQSQINIGDSLHPSAGHLDTRGTFGNLNQPLNISGLPSTTTSPSSAVRHGLDLTNISINGILPNRTSRAFIRFESTQDTYLPIAVGTQLDIDSPVITITQSMDTTTALPGDEININVSIKNTGSSVAKNFFLTQYLDDGFTFIPNTLTINGAPSTKADLQQLPVGSIAPNTIAVINFVAKVADQPSAQLTTYAAGEYTFSNQKEDVIKGVDHSTQLSLAINYARVNLEAHVDVESATIGDRLSYTLFLENIGTITADKLRLSNTLTEGILLVPHSLLINGQPVQQGHGQILTIPSLPPKSKVIITYQAELNEPNQTQYVAIQPMLDYQYQATAQRIITVTGHSSTTVARTSLIFSDLLSPKNFIVSSNVSEVLLGDFITYSIHLNNNGNTVANNLRIEQLVPESCVYEPNSLQINQKNYNADDLPLIKINELSPEQEVWISYRVKVAQKPPSLVVTHQVTLNYDYEMPSVPSGKVNKSGQSIPLITDLREGKIESQYAKLTSNRQEVTPGDLITYQLALKNTGNLDVVNIYVHNLLTTGLTVKPNSIRVHDSKRMASFNPLDGLVIPLLQPNEELLVSLDAIVGEQAEQTITTQGNVAYSYGLASGQKQVTDQVKTNSLSITNLKPSITVETIPNHQGAIIGDVITYTMVITNTGPLDLLNLLCKNPLSNHLEYANNLAVNDTQFFGDITRGIKIEELAIGEKVKITFDAKVTSFPNKLAKEIINRSEVAYYFRLANKDTYFTGTASSNTSNIKIFNPSLSVTMKPDKTSSQIGDLVTYHVQIVNTGNINILESALSTLLPDGFLVEEISVNGYKTMDNLLYGLDLGPITSGQSIAIDISIRITDCYAEANPFCNQVNVNYTIFTTDRSLPRELSIQCVDTVGLSIISPKLQLEKYQSFSQVVVGEVLYFTIKATNTGTVPLYNVVVQELLPHQLKLVPQSVSIDGVKGNESILRGIHIDTIEVNQTKTIHYNAEVLIKDEGIIQSSANAQYQYQLNNITPIATGIATSNTLETKVRRATLDLALSSNCTTAFLNEDITYTLNIKNNGDLDALGVILSSDLPSNILFIPDSFQLNEQVIYGVNITEGINVGNVPVGTTMNVQYRVKLLSHNNENQLASQVVGKFSFIREDKAMSFIESYSNHDIITTTISAFKQFTLDKHLTLPGIKPDLVDINNIISDGQITDCYTVHTLSGVSTQGQILTGYKLVLHGMINVLIEYTSKDLSQTIYSANYNIPFSTYLVVSSGGYKNCTNNVDLIIDNVSHGGISDRSFYINLSLLAIAL